MRKKRNLSKVLLGALALTLIPVSAVSAQKITPSSSCKVLNQKVVYQNKTYTCIKSGKTLIWNNGVTFKATESQTNPFTGEGAAERALLDAGLGIRCIPGEFCPISSTGPGGGKVFYDAGSQQSWGQYLEVAPKGWSGKAVDPSELWCNLANSDLSLANFSQANMRKVKFSQRFSKRKPECAEVYGANFDGTDLSGANFSDCNLSNVNFANANLSFAFFTNANLSGANLSNANLEDAYFDGANLSGVNMHGAILKRTTMPDGRKRDG